MNVQAHLNHVWPVMSLRFRLALLVAIVVGAVIGIEGFLETRMFERGGEKELMNIAAATAQAVADDLELRRDEHRSAELEALLHEFLVASPTVRDIAAFAGDAAAPALLARTSPGAADGGTSTAREAMLRGAPVWAGDGRARTIGVPVMRDGRVAGAVTVTTSFASLEQLSVHGRRMTMLFALPAIVVITLLVDLLARRLVHRPIAGIRRTMERAGTGEAGARAPVHRRDEIGEVAEGLNEMLGRLEAFHADLRARVDDATAGLRERNAELLDSYQRVLVLREELARAEQLAAIGQMAANMAHQIGTPLNLVSGYVQLMIEEARTAGEPRHRLETIQAQIAKVATVVRTMLDYARRPALHHDEVDVGALVEQVCEISRPALRAAGVDLRITIEPALPPLVGDPTQLELAFLNLVSNALDAMAGGGLLEICATAVPGGVRLTVRDTGAGIPPDVLPRIFEPWVTTKPAGRGTGLGLSITRDVVISHGGSITVRSDSGHGSVFTLHLPARASREGSKDTVCIES